MSISYLSSESVENSSKMEYKKETPIIKVSPSIREVSTAASGPMSSSHPITADATTEEIRNRSRGKYTAKERTAGEAPHQVRQADEARYRAQSELKTTEKEIREWMLDDPGPSQIGTEQSLHPVREGLKKKKV